MKNSIKFKTMKKLALILIGLLFSYISFSQEEKREMSNYEKYILAKEQAAIQDTVYKTDTVLVGEEKKEWDDLYYTPSKDELKRKTKDIRLEQKKIRIEQNAAYYDAKQEVYNDLSSYYSNYRYRFYFSFRPSYYYYGYYDPFYYDPWILDSWYWGWSYPYYSYPYYRSSWYFGYNWSWNWGYPYHYHYYSPYYGNNYYYNNYYENNYSRDYNNISYGRRKRPSNYTSTTVRREPVTINRTVQVDRNTGRTLSVTQENRRISPTTSVNRTGVKRELPVERRIITNTQTKSNISPENRPTYNTERRTYTPSYEQPRMSVRPQYNNTNTNRVNSSTSTERRVSTTTESRSSYSTSRTSAPARSYSSPSTNRSNYSAPSRSYNSESSSGSSRSYNSGSSSFSSPSRSSSGSSFSGGSSSGGSRSSSSGSSSGRR